MRGGCYGRVVAVAERPNKQLDVTLGGLSLLDSLVEPVLPTASLNLGLEDFLIGDRVTLHILGSGSPGTGMLIEFFSPSIGSGNFIEYNPAGWSVDKHIDLGSIVGYTESDFGWTTYEVLKTVPVPAPLPVMGISIIWPYARRLRRLSSMLRGFESEKEVVKASLSV